MVNAQLVLLAPDRSWRLDEDTKRIGRAGLAHARAVLADAAPMRGLRADDLPTITLPTSARPTPRELQQLAPAA